MTAVEIVAGAGLGASIALMVASTVTLRSARRHIAEAIRQIEEARAPKKPDTWLIVDANGKLRRVDEEQLAEDHGQLLREWRWWREYEIGLIRLVLETVEQLPATDPSSSSGIASRLRTALASIRRSGSQESTPRSAER